MSRFVRDSLLRNLVVDKYKTEEQFPDIEAADVPTCGDLIASSSKFICFAGKATSNSSCCFLDVNSTGKDRNFFESSSQRGGIYDIKANPYDHNVFASASGDGSVVIWKVENENNGLNANTCCILPAGDSKKVGSISWHPSTKNLLATVSNQSISIFDIENSSDRKESLICKQDLGCDGMTATWNSDGSLLGCLNADKSFKLIDPRQKNIINCVEKAHMGSKVMGRVVSCGPSYDGKLSSFMYTTGFSLTRDRELAGWDLRKFDSPVVRHKIGSGSGMMIPLMIPDTKILFIGGRGETSLRSFEPTTSSPFVYNINQSITSSKPILGISALPVTSCDVMSCEVSRIYKLTRDTVESIRVEIPRRMKSKFYEELFPNTLDTLNPSLTISNWKNGENNLPNFVSVLELGKSLKNGSKSTTSTTTTTIKETVEIAATKTEVVDENKNQKEKSEQVKQEQYVPSKTDKRISNMMGYIPKFKFNKATAAKKDDTIFNMTTGSIPVLAIGCEKYAVNWYGGGGPFTIGDLKNVGKIHHPEKVPILNGHTRPILALEFSPFDDNVVTSGSDDCNIIIWRLNENDSELKNVKSEKYKGHKSGVRLLKHHPTVNNLLASASQDSSICLWDISGANNTPIRDLYKNGNEAISSFNWNYDGSKIGAIDRGNIIRLFDPRNNNDQFEISTSSEKAHSGAKPSEFIWLDSNHFLTSGTTRLGYREISVWDERKLSDGPINTTKINQGAVSFDPLYLEDNGVVMLIARGENTFHTYEIESLTKTPIKPDHCGDNPLSIHKCASYIAPGGTTSGVGMVPRRVLDPSRSQVAQVYRLSPSVLEPITFTLPRSKDTAAYFSDDIYSDTKSGKPTLEKVDQYFDVSNKTDPLLYSMNTNDLPLLSNRDPSLAHASMKRGQENTAKFFAQIKAEEDKKKLQNDTLARFQNLAVQHEKYNPNLSTGGNRGHDEARAFKGENQEQEYEDDVADDEW